MGVLSVGFVFYGSVLYSPSISNSINKVDGAGAPPPSWFLHCRGIGESRPELSGDIDRRPEPASSAMVQGVFGSTMGMKP